jgi:sodium/potassium-transporting ATPase subunit alpha
VVISGVFSYIQERKSSDAMKKFKNLLPAEALALRDGIWQPVQASTLVCGDVVRVQSGAI